jgi:hypothetical protein
MNNNCEGLARVTREIDKKEGDSFSTATPFLKSGGIITIFLGLVWK